MHEYALSFSQKLVTAAACEDLRHKRQSQQSVRLHINENGSDKISTSCFTMSAKPGPAFLDTSRLTLFSSKTPPPLRHGRPAKFRERRYSRPWSRSLRHYPRRRFPSALWPFQQNKKQICFCCRQEGHFLRNCSQREHYRSQLNTFVNMVQTAAYILSHEDSDATGRDHENLDFFDHTSDVIFSEFDGTNVDFDTWVCNLLDEADRLFIEDRFTLAHSFESHFVKQSVSELSRAMREPVFHSTVSINRHMLLDTGAPRSICTGTWLQESKWLPYKTIDLSEDTTPLKFAGHPITA